MHPHLSLHKDAPATVMLAGLFGFSNLTSHAEVEAKLEDFDWLHTHSLEQVYAFDARHLRDGSLAEQGLCEMRWQVQVPVSHEALAIALLVHNHFNHP